MKEIAAGVREKRWSAEAVVRAHAERIEALEPDVRAWVQLDLERAARTAEMLGPAADSGSHALAGAPIAIKDIIDVAGLTTRCGSPIHDDAAPAPESAACVEALERAGAVIFGKTVTTEFAYYTPGKTRNPWNFAHTPGGSSMGSAAAVACSMVAGALGTQTNGSVIRPAAFCGVVGYKPSFGLVSNDGTLDPWPALDHTGVFARSVADTALLASVIQKAGVVTAGVVVPSHPLRFALVRSPVWDLAEPAQKGLLETSAAKLTQAGATIEALELPRAFDDAHRVHGVIMAYEGSRYFRELQQRFRSLMSARLNALLDQGAAISHPQYEDALHAAETLRAAYSDATAGFDAILTPPAAGEAPATLEETGSPAFCTIWTLLGVPAITIPVARGPRGLPLGLQVCGAFMEDDRALGAAAWCEAHLPFHSGNHRTVSGPGRRAGP
ncbi:MAG TPA: amidase [Burkholderiales bacterium]|nr:amidase [Burkholderiales bacterium]